MSEMYPPPFRKPNGQLIYGYPFLMACPGLCRGTQGMVLPWEVDDGAVIFVCDECGCTWVASNEIGPDNWWMANADGTFERGKGELLPGVTNRSTSKCLNFDDIAVRTDLNVRDFQMPVAFNDPLEPD